jgi:hypothetical protein
MSWLVIRAFFGGFFKIVPPWGFALSLAIGVLGLWAHHRERAADMAGYSRGHAEYTALQAEMARRALVAEEAARAEEARRAAAQQEIEDAHDHAMQAARADAAIADAAAGRLRQRVANLITAARSGGAAGNPAPVGQSPAADDADVVLADVLGRCVAAARQLAAIADERGAAGSACERSYDALTP